VDFVSLSKFLENAAGVLQSQASAWRSDRESLVTLAQYPLARKIIKGFLENQKTLSVSKLPFQRSAAALYAQIYATGTAGVEYDQMEESLAVKETDG
jgi:hypothetical protein